jgi:hypothetical protein
MAEVFRKTNACGYGYRLALALLARRDDSYKR